MNIICIEFLTFAVNSISSNKWSNKHNFEISQVDNTYTWSHLFITFAFAVNSISSNKRSNEHNFVISQVDNNYTWSHQFILITRQGFQNSGKGWGWGNFPQLGGGNWKFYWGDFCTK